MIKLNLDNLLFPLSFLQIKYWYNIKEAMRWLHKKHKDKLLWFIDLDKNNHIEKIEKFVKDNKWKYEDVVILWIWWSALWARAIMTALKWKYYNLGSKEKRKWNPRLHILDNVDPIEIRDLKETIEYKNTLFIVISKSWRTLETISQYQFFKNELENHNLNYLEHFVIIAWEDSTFKEESIKKWLEVFDIPCNVWGDFQFLLMFDYYP